MANLGFSPGPQCPYQHSKESTSAPGICLSQIIPTLRHNESFVLRKLKNFHRARPEEYLDDCQTQSGTIFRRGQTCREEQQDHSQRPHSWSLSVVDLVKADTAATFIYHLKYYSLIREDCERNTSSS